MATRIVIGLVVVIAVASLARAAVEQRREREADVALLAAESTRPAPTVGHLRQVFPF